MASSRNNFFSLDEDAVDFRYSVGEVIGEGASGVVKLSLDRVTSKNVAIKFNTHPTIHEAEIEAYKRVRGMTGVPKMVSYGKDFIAMELLGQSLLKIASRSLPTRSVLLIAAQVISRIASCHARGVYHLDIKCGNVALGLSQNANIVHLIDFGNSMINVPESMKTYCIRTDLTQAGKMFLLLNGGECDEIKEFLEECSKIENNKITNYDY